ncbi:MAG: DUF2079 domain-containing protein [Ruminococcaceae bacterium]|nr:DUF2079 domain-containing protein [Oscillospiraceae bacterium]
MKNFKSLFGKQKNKTSANEVGLPQKRRLDRLISFWGKLTTIFEKYAVTPGYLIVIAFCGFLAASITAHFMGHNFGTKEFTQSVSLPLYCMVFVCVSAITAGMSIFIKSQKIGHWTMFVLTALYACLLASKKHRDLYLCIAIGIVVFIAVRYLTQADKLSLSKSRFSRKSSTICLTAGCILFTLIVGISTVVRYTNFGGATFDLGIFTQMFEYMRTTGVPYTTVERAGLVSHFAVHFSPVYYLLLPGYMVWSHPSYLLMIQALALGLCVFPIRRICRSMGLNPLASTAMGFIWLFYPSVALGCCNDFHENKFLPLMLFWLLSQIIENKRIGIAVCTLLSLSVKEDAAIYIVCIGLYCLFAKKKKTTGFALIASALVWFVFATGMIEYFGGEPMVTRFSAYYSDAEGSWAGIIKTVVVNIGYLLQIIVTKERLEFLLWMLLPVVFGPFLTRNVWSLLLLIPMLVINLMPSLASQYDIFYQYTYGPASLIIFSCILVFSQMKEETRRFCITASVLLCLVFGTSTAIPKFSYYFSSAASHTQEIELSEDLLDTIPDDATVTARDYVVPHLYDRKVLYTVPNHYNQLQVTDYYVIDKRQDGNMYNTLMYEFIEKHPYEMILEQGYLQLWKHAEK